MFLKITHCIAASLFAAAPVSAQTNMSDHAAEDSRAFVAEFHAQYGDYTSRYVRVFLGHLHCRYDFIDETAFNDLADRLLRHLAREAETIIETHNPPSASTTYSAHLLALATVDAYATLRTAQIAPEIAADPDYCDNNREADRQGLLFLSDFMRELNTSNP